MRVLITGGAGYIGTELVKSLSKNEAIEEILVYDNLSRHSFTFFLGDSYPKSKGKVRFIEGDILDSRKLTKHLDGIDTVYHLAAKVTTPFANTDPHFFEQVNHWGTAELVYAVERSKASVKKFVFASSMGVYGSSINPVGEDTIPNPKTFYGVSKLRGEEHVQRLQDQMETFIMRCGNVYGYSKSMRFDAVINKFVFDANFSGRLSIHGDGKQKRSFIHIDLVARILHELLGSDTPGGIYNLTDKNLSVLDIVDELKQLQPELEFLFVNQHLTLRNLVASPSSKLTKYLDTEDRKSFHEELEEFKHKFSF
jgi:UDP-glucose 4-epimerase